MLVSVSLWKKQDSINHWRNREKLQLVNPHCQESSLIAYSGMLHAFRTGTATTTINTSGYSSSQDYSQYYDPSYWQNYSAWQGYYDASTDPSAATSIHMTQAVGDYVQSPHAIQQVVDETASAEDDLELVGMFTVRPLELLEFLQQLLYIEN